MDPEQLAFLDEHAVLVDAGSEAVWTELLATLKRTFSRPAAARYARLVGCEPSAASGPRPLAEGSSVPGFRVQAHRPPVELALTGRHRFSDYALTFRLDREGDRTRLRAETRADFPGKLGRGYRFALLRTGGHVLLTRRLLAGVRRRAEAAAASG